MLSQAERSMIAAQLYPEIPDWPRWEAWKKEINEWADKNLYSSAGLDKNQAGGFQKLIK